MAAIKLLLQLFALLLIIIFAHSTEDPEVELCKKQCRVMTEFEEWEQRMCEFRCEAYAKEKERRERRKAGSPSHEEHGRQMEQCRHQCRASQLSKEEKEECERRCEEHHGEGWKEGGR